MAYNMSALEMAEVARLGLRVHRPAEIISSGEDLFTVVNGNCYVRLFMDEISTAAADASASITLVANPTTGSSTDIGAALTIDDDVIGTIYTIEGLAADAIQVGETGSVPACEQPFVVAPGVIELTTTDSTGEHGFTLWYVPLEAGAYIEIA